MSDTRTAAPRDSAPDDLRAIAASCAPAERAHGDELLIAPSWAPMAPPVPATVPKHRPRAAAIALMTLALGVVAFAAVPALVARERMVTSARTIPVVVQRDVSAETPVALEALPLAPVVVVPEAAPAAPSRARVRASAVPDAVRSAPRSTLRTIGGAAREGAIDPSLASAVDGALAGRAPEVTGEQLPLTPSTRDVSTALRSLEASVARCREGEAHTASARIVIDGDTGRPESVRVTGASASESACIARIVETARFPRFVQDELAITFPYRL